MGSTSTRPVRQPIVLCRARRPFVDLRCTFQVGAGLRCLQTAQPGTDRCGLTGHGR